ncbi:metallophosphoesterase family protein [Halalkalirubrum salinum]|uniref:metallophosphoesterase family protein n=1 Tax=Halalkalirubrum salinum TaxID=2563889 RepID=UPI0010FB8BB1|nr:metallophosphoesterase [Halalkalirubrum salinum]
MYQHTAHNNLTLLARLDAPPVDDPVRLAVVADPHVTDRETGTAKLYHCTGDRLRAAFDDIADRDVDYTISVGDLTKDGAPWEYELFDELLENCPTPFLAVPGNHDVPKASPDVYRHGDAHDTPPVSRFVDRYTPGSIPFSMSVGGLDVIGINTASMPDGSLETTHDGEVSAEEVAQLDQLLETADTPVVVMHHNTPKMSAQFDQYRDAVHPGVGIPPTLRNPEPLIEKLRAHDVRLVMTGHLHMPGVATTGALREVTAPATCSYPQGYLLFDFDHTGVAVRYVPVTDIEGMTEAHAARRTAGETSAGLTAFSAIRLASAPLVDDHAGP